MSVPQALKWAQWDPVQAFAAGVAALSLNAAGYYVDIFRAAILAVPTGQVEAGQAIGMRPWQIMRRIVIPLSVRPALPPYRDDQRGDRWLHQYRHGQRFRRRHQRRDHQR